ncbi:hypothetical protein TD95_003468 [Thielaviopsis punctulata]|uniref:HTH CENPB-type domain-containing protein n=1 Tax=Thielaviopsis punctulata TaxID=72032 RepID=A0A0F4ZBR1_9PEZI|nr:hypothetical protein TD95_003468 [Thielaviopsis punctulata]
MDVSMTDDANPALTVAASLAPDTASLQTAPQVQHHDAAAAAAAAADQSPSSNPRERNSLTLNQRRALRHWANSQTNRPSHRACQEWFQREYGQTISQSTVSHSLSPKYSRLDNEAPQLHGSRMRFGNWPNVEKLVLKWYQQAQQTGRHPTNEELADKAKSVFMALPQYKDNPPPEFSPGWIHRFKKRYGLLVRRHRRHGEIQNPTEDIGYLAEALQRGGYPISPDTNSATVRELISRNIGVEPSLSICALVRDEVIRRATSPVIPGSTSAMSIAAAAHAHAASTIAVQATTDHNPSASVAAAAVAAAAASAGESDGPQLFVDEAEIDLQSAIRQLEAENAAAEATAAAVREERDRLDQLRHSVITPARQQSHAHGAPPAQSHLSTSSTPAPAASGPQTTTSVTTTPTPAPHTTHVGHTAPHSRFVGDDELTLTPIDSSAPLPMRDRPVRCPFCVNQRMLKSIKDAVEHMSTHVEV